jgi:undecaprenyl-diphosphatase
MADSFGIAALLGVIEGLTEFIPVSSTGHLLLIGHFLGFDSTGNVFEIVIQLGAILALLSVYGARLWDLFRRAPADPAAFRFIVAVALAFLPAALIGVLAHDLIKEVLFETPHLIAAMLVAGGVVLLWVDRLDLQPRFADPTAVPLRIALGVGLCQCLAMVPGVSRSGATIVGGLFLGLTKRAAAEFSFFLSMPTMIGAVGYDLLKNRDALGSGDWGLIAVGFAAAFVTAVLVVRRVLDFVGRNGFALFGWWRIGVGGLALAGLTVWG